MDEDAIKQLIKEELGIAIKEAFSNIEEQLSSILKRVDEIETRVIDIESNSTEKTPSVRSFAAPESPTSSSPRQASGGATFNDLIMPPENGEAKSTRKSFRQISRKTKNSKGSYYDRQKKRVTATWDKPSRPIPNFEINKESKQEMEGQLAKITATLDNMEKKHMQNMQEFAEQEELEKHFWQEIDRIPFNEDAMVELLTQGAEINAIRDGFYPLDIACNQENEALAKFCASNGGRFTSNANDLFMKAAEAGNIKKIDLFMRSNFELSQKDGGLAILRCIRGNFGDAVDYFLQNNLADLNVKDWVDGTPLMAASKKGDANLASKLIKSGAKLDSQSKWGGTALTLALSKRHYGVVEVLVNSKADVNIKSKSGDTCLIVAISQNHTETIDLLLSAGADVNATDKQDQTALDICCKKGRNKFCEMLINAGGDIDHQTIGRKTPLHIALKQENLELVNILLDNRACVNITDDDEDTALTLCAKKPRIKELQRILEMGCDINHKNALDLAAIHYACNQLEFDIVRLLMSSNCDMQISSKVWGTPYEIATSKENEQLMELVDPAEDRERRAKQKEKERRLNVGTSSSSAAHRAKKSKKSRKVKPSFTKKSKKR